MSELHIVFGGTGGAGAATVRELVARGKRVRATCRHPSPELDKSIEWVAVDATNPADVSRASAGASIMYQCVNVPYSQWERQLLPIADAMMLAARAADAKLVVMDNLYMYGPFDGALTENAPHRPVGHKGRLRSALEKRYLDAHREGKVRITIARASDFYGVEANSSAVMLVIDPMILGKAASWIGTLDAPHTLSYLPDVGWGLATLGEHAEALGQVWHIPAADPLTGRELVTMVAEQLGRQPRMSVISRPMMQLAGLFNPQIREAVEVYYQFDRSFVMNATKFAKAFGSRVTPHKVALKATIEGRRARLGIKS